MNVSNCKGCGRLFNAISTERLCPDCRKKLDDKFQEVKAYLEEHPNASVDEVSRENEVTTKQIRQWVREERLTFSEGSMEGIECENCGKMIRTGRFCDACKGNLANSLNSALDKPSRMPEPKKSDRDKNRMRFL